jgi:hypothetical protein
MRRCKIDGKGNSKRDTGYLSVKSTPLRFCTTEEVHQCSYSRLQNRFPVFARSRFF